jgi:hypothetical protein
VIGQDDVPPDRGGDVIEQRGTIDRLVPRFRLGEGNDATLQATGLAVIKAELRTLFADKPIKDRGAHAEQVGSRLALAVISDRRGRAASRAISASSPLRSAAVWVLSCAVDVSARSPERHLRLASACCLRLSARSAFEGAHPRTLARALGNRH